MYEIINEEELNLVSGGEIVLTTAAIIGTAAATYLGCCCFGCCCGCGQCVTLNLPTAIINTVNMQHNMEVQLQDIEIGQ